LEGQKEEAKKMRKRLRLLLCIPFVCLGIIQVLAYVPKQFLLVQDGSRLLLSYSNWVSEYQINTVLQMALVFSSFLLCYVGLYPAKETHVENEDSTGSLATK